MTRLPESTTVDPLEGSADGLEQTNPIQSSQLVKKKKRLAVTRGFDNSGLKSQRSQRFVTPQNSPVKFSPQAGSTPFSQDAIANHQLAVPIPGISFIRKPKEVQLPLHPPLSPATFIRVPVISPRVLSLIHI